MKEARRRSRRSAQVHPAFRRRHAVVCMLLVALSACVYELTSFGGIRSPDSEIVFRTSEALATRGTFAVREELDGWQGFGFATGKDGRRYSIFGPGQAVVAAPLVAIGHHAADAGVFSRSTFSLPVNYFEGAGLDDFLQHRPPANRNASGIRWMAAQLNVMVTALTVGLVYLVALRIVSASLPALFAAVVFGFGTMAWAYSGTFFSEPLAGWFALMALYLLLEGDPRFGAPRGGRWYPALAGVCLGLSTATHLTGILFTPFFLAYAASSATGNDHRGNALVRAVTFGSGLAAVLTLLGYFNFVRFGSLVETGRFVDPAAAARIGYGSFVSPWRGLYGLLVGANKGLLLFCPVVVAAAVAWRSFDRLHPFLSRMLIAAILFRIVFVASRSDWTGGFSLGPRYLVMILPYVCLPMAVLAKDAIAAGRWRWPFLVACALPLVFQQLYFALGEIFSFYYLRMWQLRDAGIRLSDERFHLSWEGTPLFHLLNGYQGPFLLRQLQLESMTLFLLGCGMIAAIAALCAWKCRVEPVSVPVRTR